MSSRSFRYSKEGKLKTLDDCLNHPECQMPRQTLYAIYYNKLKSDALNMLSNHLLLYSNSSRAPFVYAAFESLQNDGKGINCYGVHPDQQFLYVLKFLNTLRLTLGGRYEQMLICEITRLIERALKIVERDASRNWLIQSDMIMKKQLTITKAIGELEKIISCSEVMLISGSYRFGVFKKGHVDGSRRKSIINDKELVVDFNARKSTIL